MSAASSRPSSRRTRADQGGDLPVQTLDLTGLSDCEGKAGRLVVDAILLVIGGLGLRSTVRAKTVERVAAAAEPGSRRSRNSRAAVATDGLALTAEIVLLPVGASSGHREIARRTRGSMGSWTATAAAHHRSVTTRHTHGVTES